MIRLRPVWLLLCCLGTALAAEHPASVAELFGTPENLRLLREADKMDACILRRTAPAARPDGSVDRHGEHYEETDFAPVPVAATATLRTLLLSDKTFDWKAGDGRRPQFYVRLRLHRGEDVIALDFCFLCGVLNATRDGADLGHANFGPNRDLFLQAFLQVFPHDGPLRQVAKESGLPP